MDYQLILKEYKELYSKYYVENNILELEETSQQELETLDALDPDEVCANIKELITYLFDFKKSFHNSEHGDFTQIIKNYENSLKSMQIEIDSLDNENILLKKNWEDVCTKNKYLEDSNRELIFKISKKENKSREKVEEKKFRKSDLTFNLDLKFKNRDKQIDKDIRSEANYITRSKRNIMQKENPKILSEYEHEKIFGLSKNKTNYIKSVKFEYIKKGDTKNCNQTLLIRKSSKETEKGSNRINSMHSKVNSNIFNFQFK